MNLPFSASILRFPWLTKFGTHVWKAHACDLNPFSLRKSEGHKANCLAPHLCFSQAFGDVTKCYNSPGYHSVKEGIYICMSSWNILNINSKQITLSTNNIVNASGLFVCFSFFFYLLFFLFNNKCLQSVNTALCCLRSYNSPWIDSVPVSLSIFVFVSFVCYLWS